MKKRKPYIEPISEKSVPIESNGKLKHWVSAGIRSGYYESNLLPNNGEKK